MNMNFSLEGKLVVITGVGSGIGKTISKTFAEQGAIVHILERNSENEQITANEIKCNGGSCEAQECNVANQEQVIKVMTSILDKGNIDILVNNAGIGRLREFGLTYDLLILLKQMKNTISSVKKFPEQIFIVDHLAKPNISEL